MRARIIHPMALLMSMSAALLAVAQAMSAPTTGELVIFVRELDLRNITTQDATVSEFKTSSGRALRVGASSSSWKKHLKPRNTRST